MKKFGIIVAGLLFAVISSASASDALKAFATEGLENCHQNECGAMDMLNEFNEGGLINGFDGQGLGGMGCSMGI